ncbi:hypothetical protein OC834_001085 [Tilletia horrida]|uniref:Glutathione S-transferase kappa n=1 Tax=Tilletia horrida TaxID=155126 RepID=A0AAN6GG41_9BASI|nr:hypothetical protein OC834_001085 [Tilletia horrida]KAK0539674.1 hypothetical protein OC842_000865 [Tilletia horrida]
MSPTARVTLFYDVVSPWTRIALEVLRRYEKPWQIALELKPINLGYVMGAAGNKPPITVPNKGVYMWGDVVRSSEYYDVTLNQPSQFPVNTQGAQLFLRHISDHPSSSLRAKHIPALSAFFDAVWSNDQPVKTADDLKAILTPLWGKGEDAQKELSRLIEESGTKEMKDRLKAESQALVNEGGAFGMPWMVVEKDGISSSWFGSDRFEQMAAVLGVEWKGPFPDGRKRTITLSHL